MPMGQEAGRHGTSLGVRGRECATVRLASSAWCTRRDREHTHLIQLQVQTDCSTCLNVQLKVSILKTGRLEGVVRL